MKQLKRATRLLIFVLPAVIVPSIAFAALCGTYNGAGLSNPICTTSLAAFLANLLRLVAYIAFPIIVLFLVYVGFLFVSAQGNPEKLKEAKSYFFWAIVGALIVLGAEALSLAIKATVEQL